MVNKGQRGRGAKEKPHFDYHVAKTTNFPSSYGQRSYGMYYVQWMNDAGKQKSAVRTICHSQLKLRWEYSINKIYTMDIELTSH